MSITSDAATTTKPQRILSRITDKLDLGPDDQVDEKGIIFGPRDSAVLLLMDPFLALVEDKMSNRGLEWHPHHGLETVTLVVDGVLEHGDNKGHAGDDVRPGSSVGGQLENRPEMAGRTS